jgi:hypothetical protein
MFRLISYANVPAAAATPTSGEATNVIRLQRRQIRKLDMIEGGYSTRATISEAAAAGKAGSVGQREIVQQLPREVELQKPVQRLIAVAVVLDGVIAMGINSSLCVGCSCMCSRDHSMSKVVPRNRLGRRCRDCIDVDRGCVDRDSSF